MSSTSAADSIKATEILKNLILDQVRAIYGPHYPTSGYTFAVVTSSFNMGTICIQEIEYCAQAIVYIKPNSLAEWKLLAEGETGMSTQKAMESLYRKMQAEADEITSKMGVDMIYDGVKVRDPNAGRDI